MKERREFLATCSKFAGFSFLALTLPLMAENQIQGKRMNLTSNAQKNFTILFGDASKAKLASSDVEFFENYINFAFDEVYEESSSLKLDLRLKLILGALIASGGKIEFEIMLKAALKNGVSAIEVKEILYQATPYIGLSKSLEFIELCNEIFKDLGIKMPLAPQGKIAYKDRQEKGLQTQRKLFGEVIDRANAATPKDEQHIRRFLSANCFGDYYTRAGLELSFRELLTLVFLISFGGAEAQVRGHVAGNLHIGHTRSFLIEVFTALVPYIGYPRTLNALAALDELTLKKD